MVAPRCETASGHVAWRILQAYDDWEEGGRGRRERGKRGVLNQNKRKLATRDGLEANAALLKLKPATSQKTSEK